MERQKKYFFRCREHVSRDMTEKCYQNKHLLIVYKVLEHYLNTFTTIERCS